MSVSIDELVASLSANHIGQREMDLAALQTQLSMALMNQQNGGFQDCRKYRSPYCTTPSAPTPTSGSFSCGGTMQNRPSISRHASYAKVRKEDQWGMAVDDEQNEEDERRVESLLFPPSSSNHTFYPHQDASSNSSSQSFASYSSDNAHRPNTWNDHLAVSSSFATTDPFYLSTLQSVNNGATSSHFAQAGRLPLHSPFTMPSAAQPRTYAY